MNKKLIIIFSFFLSSTVCSKSTQFLCQMINTINIDKQFTSSPEITKSKDSSKYTFILEDNKGFYINLSDGLKLPTNIVVENDRITFLEKNISSNFFIATIFFVKKINNQYPLNMTNHSAGEDETISNGLCTMMKEIIK